MSLKSSSLLYLSLFLTFSCAIHAFDITKLLKKYPEFSTFNNYLTQTNLADQINKRNTITILAVDDGTASSISGKPEATIKAIISTHVILDYFDEKKLTEAIGSADELTTLYQSSGLAVNRQGFIKVALVGEGNIGFGSAVKGAPVDVELERTITTQPYNISIIKVSKLIVFPGADKVQTAKAGAPVSSQSAETPAPSRKVKAPSPSRDDESVAESPEGAGVPDSEASGQISEAPAPAGADNAADAQASSSSSLSIHIGLIVILMNFSSLLIVM
ncbi:hypothetical protein Lal_00039536 [Lupinus albus]|uniref:Putative fasciclin-like arabinogalactan protein n=1 Tax=Lupinus albus TaxID=3870 RepID=A0A6A4P0R6_LUPAL|nr:putative fasciclin-like arabinogalactan protein [Lupinus albus]KAF1885688.1 hypothetical protein Lal_00039536 [Lupinus albus]